MLQFYYNPNCPYAQRSWITLLELGVLFEPIEIELGKDNKTDWFLALNPQGKVPVIQQDGIIVYESLIVNEYLAEVFGKLMPSDPYLKARGRMLMGQCESNFSKAVFSYLSQQEGDDTEKREQLVTEFHRLERAIRATEGSYFLGEELSLVDIAYIPFFQRSQVTLPTFKGFEMDSLDLPALQQWLTLMNQRETCQVTAMDGEKIKEVYARFLNIDYFKKVGIAS